MSTVGSISNAQDPLYLLRSAQNQSGAVGRPQNGPQAFGVRLDAAAQNAGLDASQVSQLHTDLQNAVQSALKDSSGNGANRGAVKDAIDTVLKKYGIDPAAVKPQRGAHHHHGAGKTESGQDPQSDDSAVDPNAPPQNATDAAIATLLKGLPSGSLLDTAG